jgi:hypothetical protein
MTMSDESSVELSLPAASAPTAADLSTPLVFRPTTRTEWLASTYITHRDATNMTVGDFLKTKAAAHESDSYWGDPHISWTLEFLRRRFVQYEDVYIADIYEGGILYAASTVEGFLPARDTQEFQLSYKPIRDKLASRNIVVIAVNSAFQDYKTQSHGLTEGIPEKDRPQNRRDYVREVGNGRHWSFIVIDRRNKEQQTAHYVDGMIRAKRSKKREGEWNIRGIAINGETAGKVLCGFDTLLDLEKGAFHARTLKFVPHMEYDNRFIGTEEGACGPHMYAMMDYLLANKGTLIDPGLESTFNAEEFRRARATELAFDSYATRVKFTTEIMKERRDQERSQPQNAVDNLTPEVLRNISTIEKLIGMAYVPNSRPPRPPPANGKNGNNKDDDDESDGDFGNPAISKETLREDMENNPSLYEELSSKEHRYQLAWETQIAAMEKIEADNLAKDAVEQRKARNPVPNGPHTKDWFLCYPKGFDKKTLPDFAKVQKPAVDGCYEFYKNDLFKMDAGPKLEAGTVRSVMHRTYKHSFKGLSSESLAYYHEFDHHAFSETERNDKEWTDKAITARLDDTYLRLDIPLFADLSESEIQHWVERLFAEARNLMLDNHGEFSFNQARGILYRMYVGKFSDMSADDLRQWVEADPCIDEENMTDMEPVRDFLDIMYRVPEGVIVPYLTESPLHWPARQYRISNKRKRSKDENPKHPKSMKTSTHGKDP